MALFLCCPVPGLLHRLVFWQLAPFYHPVLKENELLSKILDGDDAVRAGLDLSGWIFVCLGIICGITNEEFPSYR